MAHLVVVVVVVVLSTLLLVGLRLVVANLGGLGGDRVIEISGHFSLDPIVTLNFPLNTKRLVHRLTHSPTHTVEVIRYLPRRDP